MDEFIREVDEEYRRERVLEIWRRYSGLILAVAFLVIAGVGGWRYWQHTQQQQAEAAATRFDDAVRLSHDGKADESEKALGAMIPDSPAGYRLLARFRLAAETGKQNPAEGAKAYDALAADGTIDSTMQDLARLRGAMIRLDQPEQGDALRDLERLSAPTNPWRHTARELLGLAALKRGDFEAAGRSFDAIAADRDTPAGLRSRLEIYTALAAGGPVQTAAQ
jgi:hypothetical protein